MHAWQPGTQQSPIITADPVSCSSETWAPARAVKCRVSFILYITKEKKLLNPVFNVLITKINVTGGQQMMSMNTGQMVFFVNEQLLIALNRHVGKTDQLKMTFFWGYCATTWTGSQFEHVRFQVGALTNAEQEESQWNCSCKYTKFISIQNDFPNPAVNTKAGHPDDLWREDNRLNML